MSKSRPAGKSSPKKKQSVPQKPQKNPEESRQNRYVFGCIGMILYIIPCISCLGLGYVMGKPAGSMILGAVVTLLSIPLGLLGLHCFKKRSGRKLMGLICALIAMVHVFCAFSMGGWYLVMLPLFILILLCVSALTVLEK